MVCCCSDNATRCQWNKKSSIFNWYTHTTSNNHHWILSYSRQTIDRCQNKMTRSCVSRLLPLLCLMRIAFKSLLYCLELVGLPFRSLSVATDSGVASNFWQLLDTKFLLEFCLQTKFCQTHPVAWKLIIFDSYRATACCIYSEEIIIRQISMSNPKPRWKTRFRQGCRAFRIWTSGGFQT